MQENDFRLIQCWLGYRESFLCDNNKLLRFKKTLFWLCWNVVVEDNCFELQLRDYLIMSSKKMKNIHDGEVVEEKLDRIFKEFIEEMKPYVLKLGPHEGSYLR